MTRSARTATNIASYRKMLDRKSFSALLRKEPSPELFRHRVGPESLSVERLLELFESAESHSARSTRREVHGTDRDDLRRDVATLKRQVAELSEVVNDLRSESLLSVDAIEIDPVSRWIEHNRESLQSYKGERVAIHPEKGIVAHDPDFLKVYEQVQKLGLTDDAVIHFVS